jgi:CheY-like chemotaxis protein
MPRKLPMNEHMKTHMKKPTMLVTALMSAALFPHALAPHALAAEGFTPDPRFPSTDQVRELLSEGVKEYHAGRFGNAAKRFHDALLQKPDHKLCYEFYLAAGDGLLIAMEEHDELRDVLKDLLRQARIYQKELRRDPKYLGLLIDKLEKSEEERLVATNELVAVGPMAVPSLVARMNDNRQDDMRVYCRIVLTRMGYRSVIPLIEALNAADERLVASVATVLADIGDPRALPKLKQLLATQKTSDVVRQVVTNTVAAITAKNATSQDASAEQLYFLEALRYFRAGDIVRDEMVANESLVWRWEEGNADTAAKLTYVRVPRYAWNELIAEQILFAGLQHYSANTSYQPLLAAVFAAQDTETLRRQRIAKERTTPVENPDESLDAISSRLQALSEIHLRVRMFGAESLYRAVQQAIVSERYDVAVYLMRQLQDANLAKPNQHLPEGGLAPEKAGTVLVAALDHSDKTVRYQAAITLAHLDPALKFYNAEKVTSILSDAVGEWGNRVVLVVDQDYRQRNVAREQLQSKGFRVFTVADGFDAVQRLEESPIKDAIIIAGDLIPTVRDAQGGIISVDEQRADTLVAKLAKDWRAEKTPVFVSLPDNPELAQKIQKAFEGAPNVKGFLQKPFNSVELAGQIEGALKDADLPNANREDAEDVSLRAAKALQRPDPTRSQFDLAKAAQALAGTLDARTDEIRIEAAKALGVAAAGATGETVKSLINKVTDVYGTQDATLKPGVRAALLFAIGQLNPNTDTAIEILLKALKYEDADAAAQLAVRTAAAEAVGHASTISPELLYKYQLQQRLDVRAPGAGNGETKDAAGVAAAANQ